MKIINKFFLMFTLLFITHSTNTMQNEDIIKKQNENIIKIKNLVKELIEQFKPEDFNLNTLLRNKEELKKVLINKLKELLQKSNLGKIININEQLLDPVICKLINHLETIFTNDSQATDSFIKNLAKFIIQKSQEEKYAIIFSITSALLFLIITNKLDNYIPQGYTIIFAILTCLFVQNQISRSITQTDALYKEIEEVTSQFLLDAINLILINNK